MNKKLVNIYDKKLDTSENKFELRRIYYSLLSELSANKINFKIKDQNFYQKIKFITRKRSKKNKISAMPFTPKNILLNRKSIFYHTISDFQNHLSYKPGYFPGYFYLNPTGYSGWATKRAPSQEFIEFVEKDLKQLSYSNKINIENTLKIKDKKNYILILLQTENDSVQNLHEYSFSYLLDYWKKFSIENNFEYLIKKHPKAKYSVNLFENHKEALLPYKTDLFSAIDSSKFCVTHNSGAGLQAILRGKKVIIHANTDFIDLAIDNRKYLDFKNVAEKINRFKVPSNRKIAENIASIHFCVDYPKELRKYLKEWV